MNLRFCLLVFMLCLSGLPEAAAQDDVPWWRHIFGQRNEVSEELPEEELPGVNPEGEGDFETGQTSDDVASPDTGMALPTEMVPPAGSVHVHAREYTSANSGLIKTPDDIRIPGFRVQLFMGKLDTARTLRAHLVKRRDFDLDVHLTPYPPMFGVQVGSFTSALEAHRAKAGLIGLFPDALVVPAELTLKQAFPLSSDCIRTPRMHIEHSD